MGWRASYLHDGVGNLPRSHLRHQDPSAHDTTVHHTAVPSEREREIERENMHIFVCLFVCSFVRSFVCSFLYSFVRSFVRSFFRSREFVRERRTTVDRRGAWAGTSELPLCTIARVGLGARGAAW